MNLICSQCLDHHVNSTFLATLNVVLDECKNKTGTFAPVVIVPLNATGQSTKTNRTASRIERRNAYSGIPTWSPTLFGGVSEGPKSRHTDLRLVTLIVVLGAVGMAHGMAG